MFNSFVGVGNLTKDPDIKFLPSGDRVATLSIAFNKKFKNKSGGSIEKTCFLDGRIFGKFVEAVEQYLKKGDRILVQGELNEDVWHNQNGDRRSKHILAISSLRFLSTKKEQQHPEINLDEAETVDMSHILNNLSYSYQIDNGETILVEVPQEKKEEYEAFITELLKKFKLPLPKARAGEFCFYLNREGYENNIVKQ